MHDGVGMQDTRDSQPVHRVSMNGFWMDKTEVTNQQFARFVKATGYVTVAEQTPRAEDFPGAPASSLVPGSVVFTTPPDDDPFPLTNSYQWWSDGTGASWRHPQPRSEELNHQEKSPYQSCMSRTRTHRVTRRQPESVCRTKRNGNVPRAGD